MAGVWRVKSTEEMAEEQTTCAVEEKEPTSTEGVTAEEQAGPSAGSEEPSAGSEEEISSGEGEEEEEEDEVSQLSPEELLASGKKCLAAGDATGAVDNFQEACSVLYVS